MATTIQELTDKIYQEGIEKAKAEADVIIANAKAEAEVIVLKAQAEAQALQFASEKTLELQKASTQAELTLYGKQAVEALKSEITNLLNEDLATLAVQDALKTKDFMLQLILTIVKNWSDSQSLTIQTSEADALRTYLQAHIKDLLDKKVNIEQVNAKPSSFVIQPAEGSYKLVFGEEELIAYFKEFLRPKVRELLFK